MRHIRHNKFLFLQKLIDKGRLAHIRPADETNLNGMFHSQIVDIHTTIWCRKGFFWPQEVILVVLEIQLLILLRVGVKITKVALPIFYLDSFRWGFVGLCGLWLRSWAFAGLFFLHLLLLFAILWRLFGGYLLVDELDLFLHFLDQFLEPLPPLFPQLFIRLPHLKGNPFIDELQHFKHPCTLLSTAIEYAVLLLAILRLVEQS